MMKFHNNNHTSPQCPDTQHSAGAAGGYREYRQKQGWQNLQGAPGGECLRSTGGARITGGHINDCTEAPTLIEKIDAAQVLVADKGYGSQIIRDKGEALGMNVIIPRKKNSVKGNKGFDWPLYKLRRLAKNAFARLKHYRAVATRYDKLTRNYESIVSWACAFLWLPM
jgi:transposase